MTHWQRHPEDADWSIGRVSLSLSARLVLRRPIPYPESVCSSGQPFKIESDARSLFVFLLLDRSGLFWQQLAEREIRFAQSIGSRESTGKICDSRSRRWGRFCEAA